MNILLTSVGRRTYMIEYFRNALMNTGKVFASNSILTHSLKQADDYIITPPIYDEKYIDFLLDYCKEKSIHALISLFDIDLPVLSRNRKRFSEYGVKLIVSDEKFVDVCNDKWKTNQFLWSIGIKHPQTCISFDDCIEKINTGEIKFPLGLSKK